MLVTVTCSTGVGVSLVGDTLVSLSRPLRYRIQQHGSESSFPPHGKT